MEEKTCIKSEQYNIKKLLAIFIVIGVLAFIGYVAKEYIRHLSWYESSPYMQSTYASAQKFAQSSLGGDCMIGGIIAVIIIAVGIIVFAWLSKIELTVTDKRVYGTAAFGKRVDLPLDSISAVGSSWPKGISVATSSGKISFLAIKNNNALHKCISDLLINRQSKPTATTINQEISQSNADELKKYKELLDGGVITQEEFDAKKKQLLGL